MNSKLNYIQNWPELAKQANWSASKLAKICGVSMSTLERYFLKRMGKSPKGWLSGQRQQQAAAILQEGVTVKETAYYLGYKHPSHLTNEFKKHWGNCPTYKATPPRLISSK